jgi:hypothetical protein
LVNDPPYGMTLAVFPTVSPFSPPALRSIPSPTVPGPAEHPQSPMVSSGPLASLGAVNSVDGFCMDFVRGICLLISGSVFSSRESLCEQQQQSWDGSCVVS